MSSETKQEAAPASVPPRWIEAPQYIRSFGSDGAATDNQSAASTTPSDFVEFEIDDDDFQKRQHKPNPLLSSPQSSPGSSSTNDVLNFPAAQKSQPQKKKPKSKAKPAVAESVAGPAFYHLSRPQILLEPKASQKDTYINVVLYAFLSIGGFFIAFSAGAWDWGQVFGSFIFNAGFTPFVLSLWAVLVSSSLFRVFNSVKLGTASVLLGIGIAILLSQDAFTEPRLLIGSALFGAGAMFFIGKLFLLEEDSQVTIQRLHAQLQEALQSPAQGLAISYFYNFVLPTAANIKRPSEEVEAPMTPVDMEIKRNEPLQSYTLTHSKLIIFVPRHLFAKPAADSEPTMIDLKAEISRICREGNLPQGKPNSKHPTHRPMFVYFLQSDPANKTCDGMFDIPTVISSIGSRSLDVTRELMQVRSRTQSIATAASMSSLQQWKRKLLQMTHHIASGRLVSAVTLKSKEEEIKLPVDVPHEIALFQNALLALIQQNEVTSDVVEVVSCPAPPFDVQQMRNVLARLFRS